MTGRIEKFLKQFNAKRDETKRRKRIAAYIKSGRIAWSDGYSDYRIEQFETVINNTSDDFTLPINFGVGLDERIVEFPWIMSKLSSVPGKLLDAGSTLNHKFILDHPKIKQKDLTIYTYAPELPSFFERRISYQYGDLRHLPFQSNWFDEITCISTLEHIDMDNKIYGYDIPNNSQVGRKSYEFLKATEELLRVLKSKGKLLITVPFGLYEAHGFFQQFDGEMIQRLIGQINGDVRIYYFKYSTKGWVTSDLRDCENEESYNPHTGKGLKGDGAAHSRAICCLEIFKS